MYCIGIDLGGTNIAAGIVDENYKIIRKGKADTLPSRPPREIVADMGSLCLKLLDEEGLDVSRISHVGIAAPGSVDPATGIIEYANNLPFLKFPVTDTLRGFLPVENIYLENDANAAALGEAVAGAAKGASISVMITLGTGVGGGIIINGKVFSGFNYAGAEIGHMVIEYGGRKCTCGRKGCFEAYSSATALASITREKLDETHDTLMWEMVQENIGKVSARTAFAAMKQGDKAGKEVVDKYISYLACGITNIINIFQPDVLSIGGGVCNEGDWLLKPLVEIVDRDQYTRLMPVKTKVTVAQLGNDAGIIGAAALGK